MKLAKGFILALILYFSNQFVFADNGNWAIQTSGVKNQLRSVFFIDSQKGWICASGGMILKTTNSGNLWYPVQSNTSYTLSSIYFIDNLTGFAAGFNGTLLKTNNGGESWYSLPTGTTNHLYEIYFYDNLNGWVVGNSGTILKTIDGGNNWSRVNYPYQNDLFAVCFITPQTGWITGNGQRICKTTNGGSTWYSYFDNSLSWLQSIKFTDENNGLAIGSSGNILKTTNGGTNWNWKTADPGDYQDIVNFGSNYSLIIGSGKIYTSSDAGSNWTLNANPTFAQLNGVSFPDENNGWAVGDAGIILKYTPWIKLTTNINKNLSKVFFSDADNGLACGDGIIIKTTNGGSNWLTAYADLYHNFKDICFTTNQEGFVCGTGGSILKTTNFGNYWAPVNSVTNEDLADISFLDNDNGWAAGKRGTILKTTDGGNSWTVLPYLDKENLSAVHFVSLFEGFVAGTSGSIAATTDGGITWNRFWYDAAASFNAAAFNDIYAGIITSSEGKVIKTANKGKTWEKVSTGVSADILSACTINSTLTWASGTSGTILSSSDKGNTWNIEPTNSSSALNGIFFVNESKGWAVGENGTIFQSKYIKPKQNMYTVTVSKSGDGNGNIFVNNELKSPESSALFIPGSGVTIKAVPDANSYFNGWTGNTVSPDSEISFVLNSNKVFTANFISNVTLSIDGPSGLNSNQEFEVFIRINNADSLKVLSFDLSYPTLYFDYVSYTAGDFFPGGAATVLCSDAEGKISSSVYTLSGNISGTGTILKLKFRITKTIPEQSAFQFCTSNILANDVNNGTIGLADKCSDLNIGSIKVWPGDSNNDNVVSITDINPVIIYFNSTGPARAQTGYSWTECFSLPWSPAIKTYADCNGNGKIEITDINAVIVNFNKVHSGISKISLPEKYSGASDVKSPDPVLSVGITRVSPESDEFWADVTLGTSYVPVQNVSIVSIELLYTGFNHIDYLGYEPGVFMDGSNFTVIPEKNIGRISASAYNLNSGYSGYGKVFRFKFKALENNNSDIMFYWGTSSINRTDGTVVYVDTVGYKGGVVPVELKSFNSEFSNNKIYLTWSTASETNNKGFEVERSFNNENIWKSIGFVPGNGTTAESVNYKYIDNPLVNGSYSYRLKQIDFDGTFKYSQTITANSNIVPDKLSLEQNFPNPFNPVTTISYSVPKESFVTVKIYDILGNEVDVLVNEKKNAGKYFIPFSGNNLSSGIYFYTLTCENQTIVKKMQLIK